MPDPSDPTPVRAQKRGNLWVIVDASGKKVAGSGAYTDEGKARAEAERINSSWKKAKGERKEKGLSEAAGEFDPRLHPRGRTGRFVHVLSKLEALTPGHTAHIEGHQITRGFGKEGDAHEGVYARQFHGQLLSRGSAEEIAKEITQTRPGKPRGARAEKPSEGEREGLEGPFRYRSGWRGFYDPKEGRYLGMDDVYMPRNFDPDSGQVFGPEQAKGQLRGIERSYGKGKPEKYKGYTIQQEPSGEWGIAEDKSRVFKTPEAVKRYIDGPAGKAAEKPSTPGMTVGDVLRHKATSGETTSEWAKRISAESRYTSKVMPRLVDALVAHDRQQMKRPGWNINAMDLYDEALVKVGTDVRRGASVEDALRNNFEGPLLKKLLRAAREAERKSQPGSKMSRRSGHDLLIEAERERLLKQIALVKEARERAARAGDHVAFTAARRKERELREALRLVEAHPTTYSFDPKLHPRDRLGQFTDVLASLRKQVRGSDVVLPHGVTVGRRGGAFDVRVGKKRVGTHLKREQAAKKALTHYDEAEAKKAPKQQYPDLAHLRRLGDAAGLFAEKPEYSREQLDAAKAEIGRAVMVRYGGDLLGPALRGVDVDDESARRYLNGAKIEELLSGPRGMGVEKEEGDREPEIGERVIVRPENPAATSLRGRLQARKGGQATVRMVGNFGTFDYPSERVIYGGPGAEKPGRSTAKRRA